MQWHREMHQNFGVKKEAGSYCTVLPLETRIACLCGQWLPGTKKNHKKRSPGFQVRGVESRIIPAVPGGALARRWGCERGDLQRWLPATLRALCAADVDCQKTSIGMQQCNAELPPPCQALPGDNPLICYHLMDNDEPSKVHLFSSIRRLMRHQNSPSFSGVAGSAVNLGLATAKRLVLSSYLTRASGFQNKNLVYLQLLSHSCHEGNSRFPVSTCRTNRTLLSSLSYISKYYFGHGGFVFTYRGTTASTRPHVGSTLTRWHP